MKTSLVASQVRNHVSDLKTLDFEMEIEIHHAFHIAAQLQEFMFLLRDIGLLLNNRELIQGVIKEIES